MEESKQMERLYDNYNLEQGKLSYWICGVLVFIIGYVFGLLVTGDYKYTWILLLAILFMFISLLFGIVYLKHRVKSFFKLFRVLEILGSKKGTKEENKANKIAEEEVEKYNKKK